MSETRRLDSPKAGISFLSNAIDSALMPGNGDVKYYWPNTCEHSSPFDGQDVYEVNLFLHRLESLLRGTSLTICQVRIIVCLFAYNGLTSKEIENITAMNQSAVSRTLSRLTRMGMVTKYTGKNNGVGRPYSFYSLSFPRKEFMGQITRLTENCDVDAQKWYVETHSSESVFDEEEDE